MKNITGSHRPGSIYGLIFSVLAIAALVSGFFVTNMAEADSLGLVLNEIYVDGTDEWVEILNPNDGGNSIDLFGYKIIQGSNNPNNTKVVSVHRSVPPLGLVVLNDGDFSGALIFNDPTDTVTFLDPSNTGLGAVSYGGSNPLSAPDLDESLSFNGVGSYTIQAQTKGWFNDAGQEGRAPLLSTIDEILSTDGIVSNIGELNDPSATPSGAGALYFEKTGEGKIVFESILNLTDQDTVAVLQSLGEKMEMSNGWIKFDSATAEEMNVTGAKIYMYGINEFGYDSENPVVVDDLVVKDDLDTTIDPEDSEYPALGSFAYDSGLNGGQITFTTDHFTQFFMRDTMKPVVSSFDIPETSDSLTVNNIHVGAHDNPRGNPTHVMFTESDTKPSAGSSEWSSFGASSYTYIFTSAGTKTLYVWVKDAEGNISDLYLYTSDMVTITLPPAPNTLPSFDAIANQVINEDSSLQNLPITNVSPGDESEQSVAMSATSSDQSIIPDPTITGAGSTRTLTYTPVADANGSVVITVTADDGQSENNIAVREFTITVNPVAEADAIAPVITLLGVDPVTIAYGETYTDAGATAWDNIDGDITSNITAVIPVNTGVVADYTVRFNVSDSASNAATQKTRTVHVVKADQAIGFTKPDNKIYGDPDFDLLAVRGGSNNPVTFSVKSGPATVTGATVHLTGAGTITITASEEGNANYNVAPDVDQSFDVTKASAVCIINGYQDDYDGVAHGATGSCVGVGTDGTLSGLDLGDTFSDVPGGTANWTFDGGTNYDDQSGSVPIEIVALSLTGSFTADDKVYDGNTNATVLTRSLSGVISSDDVGLDGGTATFSDETVANGKTVTLAGAILAGDDASNYVLDSVATTTANITSVPDTTAPDVVLDDDHPDSVIRDADTVVITATFTEDDAIDEEIAPRISVHSIDPLLVDNELMTKVDNLTWTYEWDVPVGSDGEHTVSISAQDRAGNPNTAATGQTSYTIDNTVPTATIDYSTIEPTNGSVTATLDPSEDVAVTNNGGEMSYEFIENGSFAFEFVDEAGNEGSVMATVENIDTIAPVITLTGDNPQTVELVTGYVELGATTDDGSEVVIDASAFVDEVGSYTITYNATDTAGNSADMVTRAVDVVNTIPEASTNLQINPSSPTNNTQPTLSWDEVMADPAVTEYTVEIYDSNEETIYSETVTTNSFVPDDSLGEDNYTWNVRAHNNTGDSDWSETASFVIDTTGPSVEPLGDDENDYSLPSLREELFGVTMTFSEKLNDASRTVVENALTAGTDRALTFKWNDNNDGDGRKLRISVSGTETAIFANDVVTNVTDLADNTADSLLLVDSVLSDTQIAPETNEDGSGDATLNDEKPEVVITDPNQGVNVNIDSGTDNPTINVSAFIADGTGTLPEINITSADANVVIPASTTVTSDDVTWDGIIAAPTVTTVTLPETSGETKTLSTAIEVGFTGAKLSFDKAVRILLPGQAGKRAGYVRTGTAFTEITSICAADDQVTGDALVVDGDCKIDVGSDLIIWTKHFTSFATYTQTTNTTSNSGGSGGGSWTPYVPNSTPTPTPTPLVLGATTSVGDSANLAKYNLNEGDTVSATGSSDPDIYIVNAWGYKRLFLNPAIFNFYAHLGWKKVKSIVSGARDAFPTSGLFRNCEANDTKVYAVETTGEDAGVLHWVNMTGNQAVVEDADFFKKVFCINNNEFGWYTKSSTDFTSLSQVPVYSRK